MKNRLALFFLALFFLACKSDNSTQSDNDLTPSKIGLIAYYPYNGNAVDQTGRGHDGSVHGTTFTSDRFGKSNSAYKFNGIDQYIISTLNELKNADAWTISLWVKTESFNQGGPFALLTSTQGYNADGFYWHFWTDGKIFYRTHDNYAGLQIANETPVPIQTQVWQHHVIIVKKNEVDHYLNGTKVFTWNPVFDPAKLNSDNLELIVGAGYNFENWYFIPASIDDIYIYNRELTNSEIQKLYGDGN
jgi:hypothetical protein